MIDSESRAVSQLVATGAWLGGVLGATLGGVLGGAAGGLDSDMGALYARCLAAGFGAAAGAWPGAATGALTAALIGALAHGRGRPRSAVLVGAAVPGVIAALASPGPGPGWALVAAGPATVLGGAAAVVGWRLTPPADPTGHPAARDGRSGLARAGAVGALVTGGLGAAAGTAIGVHVNPATAPFAAVELGLPAAAVGLVAGTLVGIAMGVTR